MSKPAPTYWMHKCAKLHAINYLRVETDSCPDCGTPKKLNARKDNEQAVDPPSGSGETEGRKRLPRGKELWPRSEEYRRKVSESRTDTSRRQRIAAALPEIRSVCWSASEEGGDLTCYLCGATVPDGADQQTRDAAHLSGCFAASSTHEGLEGL